MISPAAKSALVTLCTLALVLGNVAGAETIHRDDFAAGLEKWIVEQMPGGRVEVRDGVLRIDDEAGCTVWFREKLRAPITIHYEATVRADGRVSDLNCFWMASDPARPENLFAAGHKRTGVFATYDSLRTYYVGYGGNANSTTRFRRYDGSGARPLLPEHDLNDRKFLLEPGRTYRIELRTRDGVAEFLRDGEVIFTFRDPAPLTEGWFGFRTVKSKIEIRNFRVTAP
jgi:hypothetical protein